MVPLNCPLHLSSEVADWWQQLRWSSLSTGRVDKHSHEVTWLELLDFEVATGVRCSKAATTTLPSWGRCAELRKHVAMQVLKVRGQSLRELKNSFGVSYSVCTLAPFGQTRLKGFLRRPRFVGNPTTTRVIARTSWEWATSDNKKTLPKNTSSSTSRGTRLESKRAEQ